MFGECKWTTKKTGLDILENLERKTASFQRLNGFKVTYALFCKNGFERRLITEAASRGILLFEGLKRIA